QLVNEKATVAQMAAALDWLLTISKPGDKVIFYFNGHSDVEAISARQQGFLLASDSPHKIYIAGAYPILYLKEIVLTLSNQKVETILIFDSNHGSNLRGSPINGPKIVSGNLAQQFANESKIFSCQPGEHSLEGEQWGGGHGLFTYELIHGLAGGADRDGDKAVTLLEIARYLEDKVPAAAVPVSQIPMVIGHKSSVLALVSDAVVADSFFIIDDRRGAIEAPSDTTRLVLDENAPPPQLRILYPDLPANHAWVTREDSLEVQVEAGNALDFILINNQKISGLGPRQYNFTVPLKPGLNYIYLAATKGYKSVADTLLVYADYSPTMRYGLSDKVRHYALFIGIDQYEDPNFKSLVNPVFDNRSIAQKLASTYGFEIDTLFNASKTAILTKLQQYALRFQDENYLKRNDHLLIFFSGHGAWDNSFRQGHLVTADSRSDDRLFESYISYADLQNKIDNLKIKHVLVVVDACYAGTYDLNLAANAEKAVTPISSGISIEFVQEKLRYQTRRLLAAGRDVPVSDGRPGEHSPFARQFLEALEHPEDGVITLERLQQYLDKSRPVPYSSVFGKNDPGSNFLMLRKG
ncbi:MAG: hypothetical protein EP344_03650, partial [Bacteroidetes bacterium]